MSTFPTDAEREAVPCTRVCADRYGEGARHTPGCGEVRDATLDALAPHIAAREAQAAARELRNFGLRVNHEYACAPDDEWPEDGCPTCNLLSAIYSDANDWANRIERDMPGREARK